mmetsp:Transcript_31459/g.104094  ORF Transcript_31459/g.104094 Transcript_31459/m.104094 type:complete len:268 (-) Transcript_31459:162-965(-)|eukprot:CAMPEP_0202768596 /NCGR_PEP_ID=MMETSP1388-20130828/35011_1 /ASSEMBLY_ACC=CAM_ASM_000864 /TAXON_ID=37098 /ORGANISM="Isochrysis sp, Strain CCMP1244" /LENGTH=267 /DNA_ID=CAMNT_0049437343 /DNA_START=5 /DNA_END=808 /DNA_ORIENTATION=-
MRSLIKLQYMLAGVAAARECGVATYTAEQVIPSTAIMDGLTPPVVVGDASNLLSPPVLDLGGVWWIRYQPLDDSERGDLSWENPAVKLYAHGAFEELMTFADASSNSSTLPAEIGLAYNRMHHWAYTDTFNSYAGRIFNAADEVDTPIHMTFGNATHGMLRATSPDDQWLITKLDKDRWRRDTVFAADGPVGGARVSYILTRVVREDGSPHPTYFEAFTSYMGARQLRVHATDNVCLRRCGAWAPELTCQVPQLCDTWCELSGTWCA